jgi:hypothetical protein
MGPGHPCLVEQVSDLPNLRRLPDRCCRHVFGNERGKVLIDDAVKKEQELRCQFTSRRDGCKAATRGTHFITGSAYTQDASPGDPNVGPSNSISDSGALTPQAQEDMPLYPSTPPWANPVPAIDPRLINTSELDSSMITLPSPRLPQTPNAPEASVHHDSPLSNVSDNDGNMETTGESLKRKRATSNTNRPRA